MNHFYFNHKYITNTMLNNKKSHQFDHAERVAQTSQYIRKFVNTAFN